MCPQSLRRVAVLGASADDERVLLGDYNYPAHVEGLPAAGAQAAGSLDTAELSRGLKAAGLESTDTLIAALVGEAADHASRVQLEERERTELGELGRPTYELPMLSDTVDLACLYDLSEQLAAQGLV